MDSQFGEHARHTDFSGQAADIGLFRTARSRTRRITTTHGSALIADGHIGRGFFPIPSGCHRVGPWCTRLGCGAGRLSCSASRDKGSAGHAKSHRFRRTLQPNYRSRDFLASHANFANSRQMESRHSLVANLRTRSFVELNDMASNRYSVPLN